MPGLKVWLKERERGGGGGGGGEEGQKKKVYTESNLGPLTLRDIGRYAYKLTIAMDRSFIIIIVVLI